MNEYSSYNKYGGRVTSHVVLKNYDDSIIDLDYMQKYKEDAFQLNDSIFKYPHSLKLSIYRSGVFHHEVDLNINCRYVNSDTTSLSIIDSIYKSTPKLF